MNREGLSKQQIIAIAVSILLLVLFLLYFLLLRPVLLKVKYKLTNIETIRTMSEKYDLDPYFVCAVIFCESSFRSDAESPVGAVGLMQLMPATAEEIAREMKLDGYTVDWLRDPAVNIEFGCYYLREQMDRFDQKPNVVLSAYNAGPAKTREWIETYGLDDSGSVSYIPYGETERYVKRVNSAMRVYKKLYPDDFAKEVN